MNENIKYKQVIVMRKFPSLRTGKYIAQGCHASQIALLDAKERYPQYYTDYMSSHITKIVVYVNTEEELQELYQKALNASLPCSKIKDAGFTEFKGIPTFTAVGIGPAPEELIDKITKHLPLF